MAKAKAVCDRCSVRATCLGDALARIPYGIAGDLTEDERRAVPSPRPAGQPASGE